MDFYKSEETYLAHYGVMGMKWGVRKSIKRMNRVSKGTARMEYWRDFNKGGSVTTKKSKKKRKISGVKDSPLKGKAKIVDTDKKDESKKGPTAKDIENFGKKVSDVNNATRTISSNVETIYRHIRNTKSKKNRANSLTDDELRAAINRIQLEQRYNELTAPQKSNGYEKTMAALAIIGSAATIAGTGITIASGIKKLRQK